MGMWSAGRWAGMPVVHMQMDSTSRVRRNIERGGRQRRKSFENPTRG